jgi:hypothetical protein
MIKYFYVPKPFDICRLNWFNQTVKAVVSVVIGLKDADPVRVLRQLVDA